jgi:hypothetical protein
MSNTPQPINIAAVTSAVTENISPTAIGAASMGHGHSHNHDGSYAPTHSHPYSDTSHTHEGGGEHDHDDVYELIHSHPYAATIHNHDSAYSATGHGHTHNHDGSYAAPHSHPYSSDTHNHSGVYEPTHSHPYAATGHTHPGGSGPTLLKTTGNQTINGGAGVFVDITGLTFPVVSGTDYAFDFYITFQSAAATTGWKAGVNCPAGPLDFWAGSPTVANGAAGVATHTERHNTVRDDMTLLTATVTQAVDLNVQIRGRYLCTANGTFAARFANELASNTQVVVQKGSWGLVF